MQVATGVNNTSGVSSWVDGFKDFVGQVGTTIGGGVVDATGRFIDRELTERFPPQDFSNGSTGSPQDTAINEVKKSTDKKDADIKKYAIYGGGALLLATTIYLIARR